MGSVPPSPAFRLLRESSPTISVGLLTADLLHLGSEIALLERTGVRVAHVDVMDGCFTPAMTVGPPWIRALKGPLLKDVHLMIRDPIGKVADYVAAGADIVTVHVEADLHIHRVLQSMGRMVNANDPARGLVRGVALNPGTPLEALDPILPEVEMVVLLAVNPGWGGQSFIPSTFARIERLHRLIRESEKEILVCVDGGVTRSNIVDIAAAGADLIVTGSAVFDGRAPEENARFMLEAVRRSRPAS
jgi:ribulose-phosphate 3-epimerase